VLSFPKGKQISEPPTARDNYDSFHIHIETTYYSTNTMAGKEGMFGVEELTSAKSFS
jgi:hypothetical protein